MRIVSRNDEVPGAVPAASRPIVTLLTDFGYTDAFAGVMKGVIKSLCLEADIIDLTHGIPPQQILAGAIAWESAWRHFPPGTIHIGVVDPGVGTSRRSIAAEIGDFVFLCPDNGLLTFIAASGTLRRAVSVENEKYISRSVSRTFHGRDIFAPAAAHVAAGVDIDDLGPRIDDITRLDASVPVIAEDCITAHVVYFDTFGNAFTDLTEQQFTDWGYAKVSVRTNRQVIGPLATTYADVPPGEPVALFASHGRLEVAVRNGSAKRELGIDIGDEIRIERTDASDLRNPL